MVVLVLFCNCVFQPCGVLRWSAASMTWTHVVLADGYTVQKKRFQNDSLSKLSETFCYIHRLSDILKAAKAQSLWLPGCSKSVRNWMSFQGSKHVSISFPFSDSCPPRWRNGRRWFRTWFWWRRLWPPVSLSQALGGPQAGALESVCCVACGIVTMPHCHG